mmetsp:Transcript_50459/g.132689  ORF Transcript_50459/g.132689 Transcript_50459/m.132689 type:complete len:238 (+) Transcript_50459:1250-1963(+)
MPLLLLVHPQDCQQDHGEPDALQGVSCSRDQPLSASGFQMGTILATSPVTVSPAAPPPQGPSSEQCQHQRGSQRHHALAGVLESLAQEAPENAFEKLPRSPRGGACEKRRRRGACWLALSARQTIGVAAGAQPTSPSLGGPGVGGASITTEDLADDPGRLAEDPHTVLRDPRSLCCSPLHRAAQADSGTADSCDHRAHHAVDARIHARWRRQRTPLHELRLAQGVQAITHATDKTAG